MVCRINIHKGLYRPIGQLVTQSSSKFSDYKEATTHFRKDI